MIRVLCAALLVFSASPTMPVKVRAPDFSGHWAIAPRAGSRRALVGAAPEAAAIWAAAGDRRSQSRWIPSSSPSNTRSSVAVICSPPLKFVYALDGTETKNAVMMGRGVQEQRSKTAWDGDTLVITTMHQLDDPSTGKPIPVEVTQKLSLESATVLIVETIRGGVLGGLAKTTKTKYTKG